MYRPICLAKKGLCLSDFASSKTVVRRDVSGGGGLVVAAVGVSGHWCQHPTQDVLRPDLLFENEASLPRGAGARRVGRGKAGRLGAPLVPFTLEGTDTTDGCALLSRWPGALRSCRISRWAGVSRCLASVSPPQSHRHIMAMTVEEARKEARVYACKISNKSGLEHLIQIQCFCLLFPCNEGRVAGRALAKERRAGGGGRKKDWSLKKKATLVTLNSVALLFPAERRRAYHERR